MLGVMKFWFYILPLLQRTTSINIVTEAQFISRNLLLSVVGSTEMSLVANPSTVAELDTL